MTHQDPERNSTNASFTVIRVLLHFQPTIPCYTKNVGSSRAVHRYWPSHVSTYVIERPSKFLRVFDLIINDMKRLYRKVFKSKKPSLGSIHEPGTATLTSTIITSTTDLMPSIPASDATATSASAQVTAGLSVSVQLHPSHL